MLRPAPDANSNKYTCIALGSLMGLTVGALLPLYYSTDMVSIFNTFLPMPVSIIFSSIIAFTGMPTGLALGKMLGLGVFTALRSFSCLPNSQPLDINANLLTKLGVAITMMPPYFGIAESIGCFSGLITGISLTSYYFQDLADYTHAGTATICTLANLLLALGGAYSIRLAYTALKSALGSETVVSHALTQMESSPRHNNHSTDVNNIALVTDITAQER